ncbi:hypothetical protein LDENG_00030870, partial [Lucifuga dentata]
EHHLSLYADDVLLYLKKPQTSISNILETITQYNQLSGYKISLGESQALYFYAPDTINLQSPFKLADSGFQYLGIHITPDLNDLFTMNYLPLVTRLKQDMSKWNVFTISLFERINIVKMNVTLFDLFISMPSLLPNFTFFQRT